MSQFSRSDVIEMALWLHHETVPGEDNLGALKVSDTGDRQKAVWLPKSAVEVLSRKGAMVRVAMPETLAIEKGLL